MTAQPHAYLSPEEYLAAERASDARHEYLAGRVYAMAGGSARHNRIAGSTYASLYAQLRGRPCTVYTSDMRVKILQVNVYTYPDISIVCGHEQFEDSREDTLLNPVVIIEILSPSTEKHDRGKKFQHYRNILSLREYILISQHECHVERFTRQSNNTWVLSEASQREERIELPSIQCVLRLDDVYERVVFPLPEEEREQGDS